MLGFYSDKDTCWNCKYFDCLFVSHRGCKIANQIDYHRQYTCNKQGISFWNYAQIIKDGGCPYFGAGLNSARYNYGCVEPLGNIEESFVNPEHESEKYGFSYEPLYTYEVEEQEEGDCHKIHG